MSRYVEFDSDVGPLYVEVEDVARATMRGGRPEAVVDKAGDSLEHVLGRVGPTVGQVVSKWREGAAWPDVVEVEFGVTLSADANVVIARSGGEANFKVTMRWEARTPVPGDSGP